MKIWVDADACPKAIKEILIRAADRLQIKTIFVANQWFRLPHSAFIHFILVDQGADIADDKITNECTPQDLVITADIPLAVRIVEKGALALDPRGTVYDKSNIGAISDMRDFMDTLRNDGVETGGPNKFSRKDGEKFANALNAVLTKRS